MFFTRSLATLTPTLTLALALTLLAGCSDDRAATPIPVTSRSSPTTTEAHGPSTSAPVVTTTTAAEVTTTIGPGSTAPPVTRPLTTAPPSALLTEVTAAYDAAYADLLAAEAVMDENDPHLEDHIAPGQAEQWRTVIRGLKGNGQTVRVVGGWSRIESLEGVSNGAVQLNVCRADPSETLDQRGSVVGSDARPFRYVETFERVDGSWKWSGREWVDPSPDSSDCAGQ